jgi:hypothetical protein
MDRHRFDDLARALAKGRTTRRTALRVLGGGALASVGVTAQAKGNGKVTTQGDRGGQCLSPGSICLRKPKKGSASENRGCKKCCGSVTQLTSKKGKCCNHNGLTCSSTEQCCLGVCTNGTCQNDVIQLGPAPPLPDEPPPPPPDDPACVAFNGACAQSAECCRGVPCTNYTCRYP